MKRALLLVAHGSRRLASNQEVEQFTQQLRQAYAAQFDLFHTAFLELVSPTIEEGVLMCIEQGAEQIKVVPYFLAAGRHVAEDIPEILQRLGEEFPQVHIDLTPHLGVSALLGQAVMAIAGQE